MPAPLTIAQKRERALGKQDALIRETNDRAIQGEGGRRRNVFNGTQTKLSVHNLIEGYHLHWLNDREGRIQTAVDAGYEFVKPAEVGNTQINVTERGGDLGDRVRQYVGIDEAGSPLYAYLMKIREDWYEEDQASMQERNDMVDDAIRVGKNASGGSTEGFYVPANGIKY